MTKLQDFHIAFDRPGATYAPGDIVTGKVVLKLSSSKDVREIRLEARAEAEVHWTKSRNVKDSSGISHRQMVDYRSKEHYFSVANRLAGGAGGDTKTTLASGHHSYNFSFQLPRNVPCSFEHEFGFVRYTVRAVLDRPWRFDHKVVAAFTVVAPYDLNTQPALAVGVDEDVKRRFSCCCVLNVGSLKVRVRSRVRAFVPGETIDLVLAYDNSSTRVDLTSMKLKLVKNVVFIASTPMPTKKTCTDVVKKAKQHGPFGKKGETSLKIQVPPLPPSQLQHCSFIDINYQLLLLITVSGFRFNISRMYPIEIGTVPIYYNNTAAAGNVSHTSVTPYVPSAPPIEEISPPQMSPQQQPSQQIGFVVMPMPPYVAGAHHQPMPEMPPPSYEECVSGSNVIADQNEQGMHGANVQFAPKYPVYKFPMPMPYPP